MPEIGPARASLVTYLNTAFAVVLGVILLGEPLTLGIEIGLPLVLIGSYFASRKNSAAEL
jgi:drug/metabolite transporter (DMT)-like permease